MTGPWGVLAVTLAIQALVTLAVFAVPAMAPAMAQVLNVSPTLIGGYVAVVYLGAMLASMSAGPLVLRYGAVRVSQAGLLSCALGMAVLALSPTLAAAVAGAFLTGLGYGPITPASSHLLAKSTPPDRAGLMFSLKQTGVPLGGAMAGAMVPPLVVADGVPAALWAVAAGCLLCLLLSQVTRAQLDADRKPGQGVGFAKLTGPVLLVLKDAALSRLAAFSFAFSAMQMCLAAYLVTYLNTALGYSLLAAGLALSVAQVGGVIGRVLWGYVADRWLGAQRMLAIVAAIMALCALGTAGLQAGVPQPLALALLAAFGASATGWNGVYLAEVARLSPPGMASAATGGSLAITFFGVVLGPLLFGAISGAFGSYRAGYILFAIPVAVSAWQLLRMAQREPLTPPEGRPS